MENIYRENQENLLQPLNQHPDPALKIGASSSPLRRDAPLSQRVALAPVNANSLATAQKSASAGASTLRSRRNAPPSLTLLGSSPAQPLPQEPNPSIVTVSSTKGTKKNRPIGPLQTTPLSLTEKQTEAEGPQLRSKPYTFSKDYSQLRFESDLKSLDNWHSKHRISCFVRGFLYNPELSLDFLKQTLNTLARDGNIQAFMYISELILSNPSTNPDDIPPLFTTLSYPNEATKDAVFTDLTTFLLTKGKLFLPDCGFEDEDQGAEAEERLQVELFVATFDSPDKGALPATLLARIKSSKYYKEPGTRLIQMLSIEKPSVVEKRPIKIQNLSYALSPKDEMTFVATYANRAIIKKAQIFDSSHLTFIQSSRHQIEATAGLPAGPVTRLIVPNPPTLSELSQISKLQSLCFLELKHPLQEASRDKLFANTPHLLEIKDPSGTFVAPNPKERLGNLLSRPNEPS